MYAISSAGLFLIIILILFITLGIIVMTLVNRAKRFVSSTFGTSISSLVGQIKKSDIEINTTPRSLSGGDIIFEPMIVKDFPHFHKETVFAKADKCLIDCLDAIEAKDIKKVTTNIYGDGILAYVSSRIGNSQRLEIDNISIHKRCISGYRKTKQYNSVLMQIAYEYKIKLNGIDKGLQQMKAELEYTYLFQNSDNENVISTVCPNCGGPIETSNQTKCHYCGVGVISVIDKTWVFSNIKDV